MSERSRRQVKKNQALQHILYKERERNQMRQVRRILKKPHLERSEEELKVLDGVPELVHHIQNSIKRNKNLKERSKEVNEEPEVLSAKCVQLAKALKESSFTVVYTGAGISTSAHIPDYRGPNGVWTLLQKGKDIKFKDLSLAEPTFTHMALRQMHKEGLISHIVSQNCDGLHIRSGFPRTSLSEVHGNMFIEVCPKCKPFRQYIRLFDVTEHTGLHRHRTGRFCKKCKSELIDTIVHFGEKGTLPWPMNWKGAVKAVSKADLILCLGSSLKVLRRYQNLWMTDKPSDKRPKLIIVNLQWTPKDSQAALKIHGKCDEVMMQVTSFLNINVPSYEKEKDPIFNMAIPLTPDEVMTTTRLSLSKDSKTKIPHFDLHSKTSCMARESAIKSEIDDSDVTYNQLCTSNKYLQPEVKLLDITSADTLLRLNAKKIDSRTYFIKNESSQDIVSTMTSISGWYGKGCSKLKRQKKRVNATCKRQKMKDDI